MEQSNQQRTSNVDLEVSSLLNDENATSKDILNYKVVYNSPEQNILAITMGGNVEFESYQADKELIIEVITGKILLKVNSERHLLTSDRLHKLSSKGYYLIEAFENTSLILTTIH